MKTFYFNFRHMSLLVFVYLLTVQTGQSQVVDKVSDEAELENAIGEIFWHVKAFKPNAELLRIKAIDKKGKMHDVKAIQYSEDTSVLDVKALIDGRRVAIKLLVKSGDRYYPLKGIMADGTIVDIKAITNDGEILPVKGVSRSGNIVHIRAITEFEQFYNVIAVSPDGKMNDVKGIKMTQEEVETIINGVPIFAHVKSLSPN